jgi:hypothetical protein
MNELNNLLIIILVTIYNAPFPNKVSLKGQCQEIFDPRFFSSKHPSWAPESIRIREDIRIF